MNRPNKTKIQKKNRYANVSEYEDLYIMKNFIVDFYIIYIQKVGEYDAFK